MKRHAVALFIHPFKNRLLKRDAFRAGIDTCVRNLLDITTEFATLRYNIVLPGHVLENIDPLKLTTLKEVNKRGTVEWLLTGYTEPFISFSPPWLLRDNLRSGIQTFSQLLGTKPAGFVPSFSNWEPYCIEVLRELGLQYVVLSQALLPPDCRSLCGCWSTEHLGASILLAPAHILHHYTAPARVVDWLDNLFSQDTQDGSATKVVGIHYLLPLEADGETDYYSWLRTASQALDKMVLKYQTIRFIEFLSDNRPLGLQYIPPSIIQTHGSDRPPWMFRNHLYTFDQVGIIHRKMMEVCDRAALRGDSKTAAAMVKQMFFVQDVNRFLPARQSGFQNVNDRSWTYRALIGIEQKLNEGEKTRGGQIRIVDYLRNGGKSIIMSNRRLRAYIDHGNGGTIFELDFAGRNANLVSAYNSTPHHVPSIVTTARSETAFLDHFLSTDVSPTLFVTGQYVELGDFERGRFDYTVKKTAKDVKTVLTRRGALLQSDKYCPLTVEKVFALDGDRPDLSFVYRLANTSLAAYSFVFATEIALLLPGAATGQAKLVAGKQSFANLAWEAMILQEVSHLTLLDEVAGMRVTLSLHKPANVWCYPVGRSTKDEPNYQGTCLVVSVPVGLAQNSAWTFMGKLEARKMRAVETPDEV